MKGNRLTIVERTHERWHRSHIIIWEDGEGIWIAAEFGSVEQLEFFALTLGFTYQAESWEDTEDCGIWREYTLSHRIERGSDGFFSLGELPEGAKPIKALSNGHIVTCYFTNDGETIRFYRPNPNAKAVYKPLTLEDHLAHRRIYGSY